MRIAIARLSSDSSWFEPVLSEPDFQAAIWASSDLGKQRFGQAAIWASDRILKWTWRSERLI
jgi:hypothetical protein